MGRIARYNDEEYQDVDGNSDEVVARYIALVAFERLAHNLISLHAQVQVDDHKYHEAVDYSQNLLNHNYPVAEAEIGQIMQISDHKELIPKPSLRLRK